jgi:hypothetical protein
LFASTQANKVPAKAKRREGGEGVGGDQEDSINTNAVSASTQAPVTFDLGATKLSRFRDTAPSEIPIT